MKKKTFSTELSYLLGIIFLALGTAGMELSDFGVSMVVAPAYLAHLKLSQTLPFFSFGMAEYMLQGVLLIIMALILRRFKFSYLFSFITAVFYGFTLDACMALLALLPAHMMLVRILGYAVGMLLCSIGVSLMFHTYIPGEAYEVFVMELARKFRVNVHVFKTGYDICMCLLSVALSFLFFGFGHFEGIKWGTVLCALINGWLIGCCSKFFTTHFDFIDKLPLRTSVEKKTHTNKVRLNADPFFIISWLSPSRLPGFSCWHPWVDPCRLRPLLHSGDTAARSVRPAHFFRHPIRRADAAWCGADAQ